MSLDSSALDTSALDSISSTLGELTDRISALLDDVDEDADGVSDLREVERQLQISTRRLVKIVRRAEG